MSELFDEFKLECEDLCSQMLSVLEICEEGPVHRSRCEEFGQLADRIMGAAKTMGIHDGDPTGRLTVISQFTQLCKIIGYKCAQLSETSGLYSVVVALLLDATELLSGMIARLDSADTQVVDAVTKTFLDRLSWVDGQFDKSIVGGVPMSKVKPEVLPGVDELIEQIKKAAQS